MTFCQENEATDYDLLHTRYVVILDLVVYFNAPLESRCRIFFGFMNTNDVLY